MPYEVGNDLNCNNYSTFTDSVITHTHILFILENLKLAPTLATDEDSFQCLPHFLSDYLGFFVFYTNTYYYLLEEVSFR